jgi:hypothetical protein
MANVETRHNEYTFLGSGCNMRHANTSSIKQRLDYVSLFYRDLGARQLTTRSLQLTSNGFERGWISVVVSYLLLKKEGDARWERPEPRFRIIRSGKGWECSGKIPVLRSQPGFMTTPWKYTGQSVPRGKQTVGTAAPEHPARGPSPTRGDRASNRAARHRYRSEREAKAVRSTDQFHEMRGSPPGPVARPVGSARKRKQRGKRGNSARPAARAGGSPCGSGTGVPRRPVHTRHGIGALAHSTFIPQRSAASGAHSTDQSAVVVSGPARQTLMDSPLCEHRQGQLTPTVERTTGTASLRWHAHMAGHAQTHMAAPVRAPLHTHECDARPMGGSCAVLSADRGAFFQADSQP